MDENKGSESDKDYSIEQASKIKPKNRTRKRKRNDSNSSTDLDDVLPENTLEIEKSLHAAAVKNNLDDISVKKILKKGVPLTKNEVLLLVQLVRANKIVTDKTTNATSNRLKEEAWSTISDQFNASVSSCSRRPEQLRLKWENLKKAARKRNSNISINQYKKVVTNDHVLALVKLREEEEDSGNEEGLRPKLTRSKVKELMKVSPSSAPWNSIELSPIKHIPVKTRPEVKALIAQELPDDEDDDEYKPNHDDSDDDHTLESCSDLESQPRTPATPHRQTTNTDAVQDGPFKVPQKIATKTQKKLEQEEATIALRTRSKLSLSSTPIEHIESSFIPPDDLPMPAVDDLWNNFLEECLNPASNTRHEDDDEADPEYNVAADPDANEEDEEALENSIVKISRKELNDLVTELFNVLPEEVEEQLASDVGVLGEGNGEMAKPLWDGKQEPISDEELNLPISKVERRDSISIGKIEPEDIDQINTENILTTSVETQTLHTPVVRKLSQMIMSSLLLSYERRRKIQGTKKDFVQNLRDLKELMKVSPSSAPWNSIELSPIKHIPVKTRPEVKALIAQELPDDEDDDEYKPNHDDSDDDHTLESCSDLESQPRTPATPHRQTTNTDAVQDGPFKVPQKIATKTQKKLEQEEATIALRTRSKLSLSSTPIEHIESSFIPPDDLPMPAVDDLWNNFLEECLNPASNTRHEDDDEADPEYNVAADPDANEEDEEALENSIVKISRKELNDLVTELFNVLPEEVEEQLASDVGVLGEGNGEMAKPLWDGKQEPISDEELNLPISKVERRDSISIGKIEPEDIDQINTENILTTSVETQTLHTPVVSLPVSTASSTIKISVVEHSSYVLPPASPRQQPGPLRRLQQRNKPPSTVNVIMDIDMQIYPEQVVILEQQLRQHIQLATTYFLQLFVHPVHWSYAPKYKDYLISLEQLTLLNPKSVANVCNLKPALELVKGWEESISENTPENLEMVEFIQKEVEKSRKRISQNSMYLGDFPDLFKRVVANSPVFLYPYLLPPSPCRADFPNKRYGYFISEDELMVLGLKQFSEYVEANPSTFKPPRIHARKRWSLTTAIELTCKYMFPWMNVRSMLGHVHLVRRSGDKANPIVKFFEHNIIEPVKHKLLPINPSLTLYEQPEFEMPRIWIKYLAKSSKRFKDSLHRKSHATIQPSGVDVTTQILEPEQKKPLPIDFVKPILCDRNNLLPKTKSVLVNKVDVHIKSQEQPVFIAANIYTLVQTSNGAQLLPLQVNTSTVDSATTPICTPMLFNSGPKTTVPTTVDSVMQNEINEYEKIKPKPTQKHCICCLLLRKICKTRQSLITEYFSNKKNNRSCGCKKRKYPNMTNKLKLLVNNYKSMSLSTHNSLISRIRACKLGYDEMEEEDNLNFNNKDFVEAMRFQIKLMQRTSIARDNKMKIRVNNVLSNFDCEEGNPLVLIDTLYKIFDVELADVYTELVTFLTPPQADQINKFKEYFKKNCLQDLMLKIDEQVKDNSVRSVILSQIQGDIYKTLPACEMCHRLLEHMENYPELASYTFNLFPHLWRDEIQSNNEDCSEQNVTNVTPVTLKDNVNSQKNVQLVTKPIISSQHNDTVVTSDKIDETIDYATDGSSSSDEEAEITLIENDTNSMNDNEDEDIELVTTIKYEDIETPELSITKTEVQENSSDMSMLIMSDDESIKSESSDWKRDEDKLILQVLKQFLTPEQIKDKTIIEVIEENLLMMIAENLIEKSLDDVRERVLYLLQVLGNETL